jgi:hypothetical protein
MLGCWSIEHEARVDPCMLLACGYFLGRDYVLPGVSIRRPVVRRVARVPNGGTMKYMTFVRLPESYRESGPPQELMEAMNKFVERLAREGKFVDGGGLLPSKDGVRVRIAKGKLTVIDGPFTETKEVIGGYAILETESRAEALHIQSEFMELHRKYWPEFEGESELRPMFTPGEGQPCPR